MIPMHVIDSPIGSATAKIESDDKLVVKSADNFRDDSSQRHGHSDLGRREQSSSSGGALNRVDSFKEAPYLDANPSDATIFVETFGLQSLKNFQLDYIREKLRELKSMQPSATSSTRVVSGEPSVALQVGACF